MKHWVIPENIHTYTPYSKMATILVYFVYLQISHRQLFGI